MIEWTTTGMCLGCADSISGMIDDRDAPEVSGDCGMCGKVVKSLTMCVVPNGVLVVDYGEILSKGDADGTA